MLFEPQENQTSPEAIVTKELCKEVRLLYLQKAVSGWPILPAPAFEASFKVLCFVAGLFPGFAPDADCAKLHDQRENQP